MTDLSERDQKMLQLAGWAVTYDIHARVALAEIVAALIYTAPLNDGAFKLADVFIEELQRRGFKLTKVADDPPATSL